MRSREREEKRQRRVASLFSKDEHKALWYASASMFLGILLLVINGRYEAGRAGKVPETGVIPVLQNVINGVGTSLVVAGILAIFYEVAIRKLAISDIEDIVERFRRPFGIVSLVLRRQEYDGALASAFQELRPGERIDLIGTSQRVVFSDHPGYVALARKVTEGCHFRILLLHPESDLRPCIENVSRDFGFPDLRMSLTETVRGRLKLLVEEIATNGSPPATGSIEVRLHKDLYSTLAYHSSPKIKMVGLYFAHESGTRCPAFILEPGPMAAEAEKHFDRLWERSADNILVRIGTGSRVVNIDRYFPQPTT